MKKIKSLGYGSYSRVYKVSRNNEIFALKKYYDALDPTCIVEITAIKHIANFSPYIVEILEITNEGFLMPIMFPFSNYKIFFQKKELIKHLLTAVLHIHSTGWIHCDLKPDNIMISQKGQLKIIDFGLAIYIGRNPNAIDFWINSGNYIQTRSYRSPKIDFNEPVRITTSIDCWSIGCIIMEIICKKSPIIPINTPNIHDYAKNYMIKFKKKTNLKNYNLVYGLLFENWTVEKALRFLNVNPKMRNPTLNRLVIPQDQINDYSFDFRKGILIIMLKYLQKIKFIYSQNYIYTTALALHIFDQVLYTGVDDVHLLVKASLHLAVFYKNEKFQIKEYDMILINHLNWEPIFPIMHDFLTPGNEFVLALLCMLNPEYLLIYADTMALKIRKFYNGHYCRILQVVLNHDLTDFLEYLDMDFIKHLDKNL